MGKATFIKTYTCQHRDRHAFLVDPPFFGENEIVISVRNDNNAFGANVMIHNPINHDGIGSTLAKCVCYSNNVFEVLRAMNYSIVAGYNSDPYSSKKDKVVHSSEWQAWKNSTPGECACGRNQIGCPYHDPSIR